MNPRLISVTRELADDAPWVATITVSRGLASGKLDEVRLSEVELSRVVAEGARILSTLARNRDQIARANARLDSDRGVVA